VSVRTQVLLWAAQRITAGVLALCVVVHLATMIYAVRHGLSASAILDRTHGSYAWFAFYATFVAAVAIHAPIGLRTILAETFAWRGVLVDALVLALGAALALWGWRAVLAVFTA
jgi:fumarate reductase subunit C